MRLSSAVVGLTVLGLAMGMPLAAIAQEAPAVRMLNRGPAGETFAYDPAILRIPIGAAVRFVSTDPGHNAISIPQLLPEGATPVRVNFNETRAIIFDRPGVYGILCTPHVALGMVGLIVVGDAELASVPERVRGISALPARARERLAALARD